MVDLTIRGAGIFGLSIAWICARRGASVVVVDPKGPGAGASGGIVGALAPHVPENWNDKKAFQLDSLLKAQDFWTQVSEVGEADPGYARTGRLQPIADDRALALARERCAGAAQLWRGQAQWRVMASDAAPAWRPSSPTGWLIHDTLTARIHPRRSVLALVKAIRALGGEIVTEAPDRGAVIWATGADGLRALSHQTGKPVGNAVKGQAALLGYDAGPDAPQLFVGGVHFVPHADGTLAIGSTSEREFSHPTETDSALDALIATARQAMPCLAEAPVLQRWAGLRPRAKSRAPALGPFPDKPGHFVANGGFKIGFGMAPGVAEVMADLVLDGRDQIPPAFHIETCL